jgi:Beta-propeller domains of methanol dehydrogenase type
LTLLLRRILAGCGLILLLLCAFGARADVAVPALTQRVTDLTATLDAKQTAALDARLASFEAQKGSQIAVLIVPTTQPEDIAQYSIRVAEQWKIGRKKIDDGVILLVAKNDHKLRIEVGYGLEGAIPDAIAKRIVSDTIVPHFKSGDFYGGIDAGVTQLMQLIQGEALPPPAPQAARSDDNGGAFLPLLIGGVVVGFVLSMVMGRRSRGSWPAPASASWAGCCWGWVRLP